MSLEFTLTLKPEQENDSALIKKLLRRELNAQNLKTNSAHGKNASGAGKNLQAGKNAALNDDFNFRCVKKSVDARHGQLKLVMRFKVWGKNENENADTKIPIWKKADSGKSVIIVGAGPAGLFGALTLLENGIKPIIIERGSETSKRKRDIAAISTKDFVNSDSNYCFGEGGAGTFSDGKLYTRSNKRGDISRILAIFNYFGASDSILTDAHPHIGTNKLPQIINNMRAKIIELGGEFHFDTRVTSLILDEKTSRVTGVKCTKTDSPATDSAPTTENTFSQKADSALAQTNSSATATSTPLSFHADAVLLATGHSATDIYKMIADAAPDALEAKTFAVGVRVEHSRELIDKIQFHGKNKGNLGAAEYRVTTQVDGRGVYSFCMCPGGFVVPSASENDGIVVNGMSAAARNSAWSNAAIVVETRPEDIPQEFVEQAKNQGCPALAGLFYRTKLEQLAKQNGKGQAAPAQKMTDFLKNKTSAELPKTSYTPGVVSSNLHEWLPPQIAERLAQGFNQINQNMKGFIDQNAVMIAIETRTSTPVRILRDKESFESPFIKGLFPAGEGSGYSGGIVSSAMDGENACKMISARL